MKSWTLVFCAAAALALTGCGSPPRSHAEDQSSVTRLEQEPEPAATTPSNVGRNAGQVAGACVMMLKGGLLGVPIMVACLPFVPVVALATAVGEALPPLVRVNDGTGAPDFAYPSSAHFPRAEEARHLHVGRGSSGFAYPNSYWGCYEGRCR